MGVIYDPVIIPATVAPGGTTIDFTALGTMGEVNIRNAGPNDVFISIATTGAPVAPAAAIAVGVLRLQTNEALNLKNVEVRGLGLNVAAAQSAVVETVSFRRGDGGSGFI